MATPLFEKIQGDMFRLSQRTWLLNLKSVPLTFDTFNAFNAHKFRGRVTLATPIFEKIRVMSGLCQKTFKWNLKSAALMTTEWDQYSVTNLL